MRTPINASWGISTFPNCFALVFPFFCFSSSFLFLSKAPPPCILVNTEPVDALSMIIFKDFAHTQGRLVCEKLKELIPRHNFQIPIQAAIGGKIIARETIKGFKKDVLTKIHGGGARDRKRKLLDKQKKGKARAKQFGKVEIPQEAFIGVLKINKET